MEQEIIEAIKWLLEQHLGAFHPHIRAEAQQHLTAVTKLTTPAASLSAEKSGDAAKSSD
jgi:hypothetical protein